MAVVKKASTDISVYLVLIDSTTFLPKTGITATDIDLQYTRYREAPSVKVDMTALAATDSAHADNKGIEIDASFSKGLWRIDWPDAAFATGVKQVVLSITCTGVISREIEVLLTDNDLETATPTYTLFTISGTNSNGVLLVQNTGTGHAVHLIGKGAAKNALKLVSDNGDVIDATSTASRGMLIKAGGGDAVKLEGGASDGAGLNVAAGTVDGNAITVTPQGTGKPFSGLIDIGKINGNATAAAMLAIAAGEIVSGAVASGTPSTTVFISNLTEVTNDHYNDLYLTWTSGINKGQRKQVTDYAGATKTITTAAFTDAPSIADTFIIT